MRAKLLGWSKLKMDKGALYDLFAPEMKRERVTIEDKIDTLTNMMTEMMTKINAMDQKIVSLETKIDAKKSPGRPDWS